MRPSATAATVLPCAGFADHEGLAIETALADPQTVAELNATWPAHGSRSGDPKT